VPETAVESCAAVANPWELGRLELSERDTREESDPQKETE
jgi:hypothetical protein